MVAPLFLLISSMALQAAEPLADPRIRYVTYDQTRVTDLNVAPGLAAVVEFDPSETIENVIVGDADNWVVSASGLGGQLVIKPIAAAGMTNLIVTTSKRRYAFYLNAQATEAPTYVVHFSYGGDQQPGRGSARQSARAEPYSFRGDSELRPMSMSDDGSFTKIRWRTKDAIPAVFALRDGQEVLVNGRVDGDAYVIDGVADRFVFRLGSAKLTADRRVEVVRR